MKLRNAVLDPETGEGEETWNLLLIHFYKRWWAWPLAHFLDPLLQCIEATQVSSTRQGNLWLHVEWFLLSIPENWLLLFPFNSSWFPVMDSYAACLCTEAGSNFYVFVCFIRFLFRRPVLLCHWISMKHLAENFSLICSKRRMITKRIQTSEDFCPLNKFICFIEKWK